MTLGFTLPSDAHLADLTAFYDKATIAKDGTITVILKLPAEQLDNIPLLARNDGMALNMRVWTTTLPDGMQELARAVGMTLDKD